MNANPDKVRACFVAALHHFIARCLQRPDLRAAATTRYGESWVERLERTKPTEQQVRHLLDQAEAVFSNRYPIETAT